MSNPTPPPPREGQRHTPEPRKFRKGGGGEESGVRMTPQATIEAVVRSLKVAILCEFSGTVRDAFIALGHDAVSCDLLPTEKPGPHIQGDCLAQDWRGYDLIVAHPPCTYLCNSGVRWLHEQPGRWDKMREAVGFFAQFLDMASKFGARVAVENPVMHGHAAARLGKPNQTIQPWQFGDNAKKRTCLWTRGLPVLVPTSDLDGSTAAADCHTESPGPDRWKNRSRTYPGIARAMAEQWSAAILARRNAHAA